MWTAEDAVVDLDSRSRPVEAHGRGGRRGQPDEAVDHGRQLNPPVDAVCRRGRHDTTVEAGQLKRMVAVDARVGKPKGSMTDDNQPRSMQWVAGDDRESQPMHSVIGVNNGGPPQNRPVKAGQ